MGKVWPMYDELGVKPLIVGHNIGFALRNRIFFGGGGAIPENIPQWHSTKIVISVCHALFVFKSDRRHAKLNNPFTWEGGNWAQLDISNEFFRIYQKCTRISCRDTKKEISWREFTVCIWHIMTIRDPFSKLVCKYVWHIRPWKGLVILLLGTIVQCSFVNYFTGSNLSIFKLGKAWISIISFLYPFQPGLFMNFFSFGLAIVYSDIGHWLYWGI